MHYVLAKENDTFENIGRKFRLSPRNLRKFNDLKDKKAQPVPGEAVYIERKRKRWDGRATPGTTSAARAKRPTPWASPTPSARGRSRNSTSSARTRSWPQDAKYA